MTGQSILPDILYKNQKDKFKTIPLKIYYIYFHDTDFVPIHVFEVINEMQKRGHKVDVFTSIRNLAGRDKLSSVNIKIHNLWTIRARFISELFFMTILFPYLFIVTLIGKPVFLFQAFRRNFSNCSDCQNF